MLSVAVEKLRDAAEALCTLEASSGGTLEETKALSKRAITCAAYAVSLAFVDEAKGAREGILEAMPKAPRYMWADMLRLLEILRQIERAEKQKLVELAREAVEIATGIVLSAPGGTSHL